MVLGCGSPAALLSRPYYLAPANGTYRRMHASAHGVAVTRATACGIGLVGVGGDVWACASMQTAASRRPFCQVVIAQQRKALIILAYSTEFQSRLASLRWFCSECQHCRASAAHVVAEAPFRGCRHSCSYLETILKRFNHQTAPPLHTQRMRRQVWAYFSPTAARCKAAEDTL